MDTSKDRLVNQLQEGSPFRQFNADGSVNEYFFYICPKLNALCCNLAMNGLQNSPEECTVSPAVR